MNEAFFGCWGALGHYMFDKDKRHVTDMDCVQFGFPTNVQLDGSRLFLPYPEIPDHGRLTYLSALNITVLSWWNRVYDTRSAVNSHFMYQGNQSVATMWYCFGHFNTELRAAHKKPYIGVTY